MKSIIIKIKAIFENIFEYVGFHYVGYKVDIEMNEKEIKALRDRLDEYAIYNDGIIKEHKHQIKVNKRNIDNNYITIENLEDNIQSVENRMDYEMDFINEDQLHEAFYDFKQENIKNGELHELKKKVDKMDGEIEDIYHDQLVYGDYNKRMDFEERLHGLGIDDEGDLSGYNEFKKEQEIYFNSMDKFETQLIQDKKEKAIIKHIKDMLNHNKKHNELIEKLLNEMCELNNLKEDNNND